MSADYIHPSDDDTDNAPWESKEADVKVKERPLDAAHGDLPPDPDAGLSAEERARIVRSSKLPWARRMECLMRAVRTEDYFGS